MLWLAVLTLPDGGLVESNLLDVESADTGLASRAYRLRLADDSVTEFSTLTSILQYLVNHYDADALTLVANSHEPLTS